MKILLLTTTALVGLAGQAEALTITTSQVLPDKSSIIAPTPDGTPSSFGTFNTSKKDANGTITALSPFQTASGGTVVQSGVDYGNASFSAVFGGGSATFTKALDPTFVTGGDTFSFIYGSPDYFNTITFDGDPLKSFTGSDGAFGSPGSGYFVTTVSGLGSYNSVTFASTTNSLEFATYNVSSVPLPASFPMFGGALLGLGAFAFARQRRNKAVTATI